LGANSLVQSVVEESLLHTPDSYFDEYVSKLEGNANLLSDSLSSIPGLSVIRPGGAMYMMVIFLFFFFF